MSCLNMIDGNCTTGMGMIGFCMGLMLLGFWFGYLVRLIQRCRNET